MKTKIIATKVDEDFGDAIQAAAEKERRSVSAFVRNVLADALAKQKPAHTTGAAA